MADDGGAKQGRAAPGEMNPGSRPLDGGSEDLAAAAMGALVAELRQHELRVSLGREIPADSPRVEAVAERDASLDDTGRFGYRVEGAGPDGNLVVVQVLMPGVDLAELRAINAQTPWPRVQGRYWGWRDAVGQVVGAIRGPNNLDAPTTGSTILEKVDAPKH